MALVFPFKNDMAIQDRERIPDMVQNLRISMNL
jgi:hypothetical protein